MKTVSEPYIANHAFITGRNALWSELSQELRDKISYQAAVLVYVYSKGLLDDIEDDRVDLAIAEQALHMAMNYDMYEALDKITVLTNQSYSDGVLSVAGLKQYPVCALSKTIIDILLNDYGISLNTIYRG